MYYTPLLYYQSSTQLIPHKSILLSCEGDFARVQAILRRSQTPLIQQTWCGEYIQSSYLSQILRIIFVEKKLSCGEISAFYTEFEQFMEFYRSLCRFCSKSMWRKICAEKIFVEIKWQIWGLRWCLIFKKYETPDLCKMGGMISQRERKQF